MVDKQTPQSASQTAPLLGALIYKLRKLLQKQQRLCRAWGCN